MNNIKRVGLLSVVFLLVLAILPFGYSPLVVAQTGTEVGGFISENTTWTAASSPYIATSSILVSEGITLTIEPGVTVRFNSNLALQIDGELIAGGTEGNPIAFTSNQSSPSAGDWGCVLFSDKSADASYDEDDNYVSGSIMEHCIVEFAGSVEYTAWYNEPPGAITIYGSSPYIHSCIIENNAKNGIWVAQNSHFHVIRSILSRNILCAIRSIGSAGMQINYNLITENGSGIGISSGDSFNITGNIIANNNGTCIYCWGWGPSYITDNVVAYNRGRGIWVDGSHDITIVKNALIGNVAPNAVALYDAHGTGTYRNNLIISNKATDADGAVMKIAEGASVKNNNLWNNEYFSLSIASGAGTSLDASNNYWGTTNETEIAKGIYDFFDDSARGIVNYQPYLIEPDTSAPPSPPTGIEATTSLVDETASINLTWNANPESDIVGYKIHYATDSGFAYNGTGANEGPSPIDVGNVSSSSLTGLSPDETYYLALTAYDGQENEGWYSEEIEAHVEPLQADFSASPTQTVTGAAVQFTNLSQGGGPPYTYKWDFDNDGEVDSTQENPSFAYDAVGEYTVSLTVTDSLENSDTEVKENYITIVNCAPDAPSDPSPVDGATDVSTTPSLSVVVADPDDDTMSVTFYDASDDSVIDTDADVASGIRAEVTWSGLAANTTYIWYAEACDPDYCTTSNTWSFTTAGEWDPGSYDEDGSGYIEIDELLHAISDYIGGDINISQLLEVISLYISHTHNEVASSTGAANNSSASATITWTTAGLPDKIFIL